MLKRVSLLIAAAIFFCPAPAPAETGPSAPGALTLDYCIRTALENNHSLLAGSEGLEAARAGVGQARSYFLPRIGVSETYMRSDNPVMAFGSKLNQGAFTSADFDVARLNDPEPIDNFNFRAELVQPIFNGGREMVGLKRARLGLQSAEKGYERARQETVYQVVRAYWGVALAAEYVKVAGKAFDTTERHLKTAQRFFDQGMLVGSEVLLAKVRLAEVKEMRVRAENSLSTAKAGLNLLMGREQDEPVELVQGLGRGGEPDELQACLDEAVRSRPDLDAMRINVLDMEAGVDMARTGYLPDINLAGRYELDDDGPFRGRGKSYTLLGTISWNIFDGFLTTKKVSEARAGYIAMGHMHEQMRQGVLFEVRRAYNSVIEAGQRIEAAKAAVAEGEEALRIIQRRFEAGMTKTLDVLDAETALTRARTNLAQALYDYNVSTAGLMLATGRTAYK